MPIAEIDLLPDNSPCKRCSFFKRVNYVGDITMTVFCGEENNERNTMIAFVPNQHNKGDILTGLCNNANSGYSGTGYIHYP